MQRPDIADLRRDYSLRELSEDSAAADPFVQFANWFDEYLAAGPLEPSAMTLSTVDAEGTPSSRIVLLKGFDENGFVFFTNYESRKARDLTVNPVASLHFFWPELERQIQIVGRAERTAREESESYFASRPLPSKLGAWASKQSERLAGRKELEDRVAQVSTRFDGDDIPCPPFWGGIRIVPVRFEFWQGRPSRLHDRICYEPAAENSWRIFRLYP
jgi:pyridoxamine 5'-phosphate oxidase